MAAQDPEIMREMWYRSITRRRMVELGAGSLAGLFASQVGAARAASVRSSGSGQVVWATLAADANAKSLSGFKSTGIKVVADLVPSASTTLAKLVAGNAGIDVMLDFNGHGAITYGAGVLAPITESGVPNLANVIPRFKTLTDAVVFNGQRYGTFADWGTDSLAYIDKGGINEPIDSLSVLFDPKWKGKIGMPTSYFESIFVGALYLGHDKPYDLSANELKDVVNLLIKQKPLVRVYWTSIGQLKNLFATGEVLAAWSWTPVLQLKQEKNIDIKWVNPTQGQLLFYNINYMTKEAVQRNNQANAEALMNYTMSPQFFVPLAEQYQYRPSTQNSINELTPALKTKLYLNDPTFLNNSKVFDAPTNPAAYQKAWNQVQSA